MMFLLNSLNDMSELAGRFGRARNGGQNCTTFELPVFVLTFVRITPWHPALAYCRAISA